jgi:hypothetical protein
MPISENGSALFEALKDGLLLCKLVNNSVPNTIVEKGLHKKPKTTIHVSENLQKALTGAVKIGIQVHNVGPEDIKNGTPHLCLGLIWQVIKVHYSKKRHLKEFLINMFSPKYQVGLLRSVGSDSRGGSRSGSVENIAGKAESNQERALLSWVNNALESVKCPKKIGKLRSLSIS